MMGRSAEGELEFSFLKIKLWKNLLRNLCHRNVFYMHPKYSQSLLIRNQGCLNLCMFYLIILKTIIRHSESVATSCLCFSA